MKVVKQSRTSILVWAGALAVLAMIAIASSGCGQSSGASRAVTVKVDRAELATATETGAQGGSGAPAIASGGFGTIRGRVLFEGTPPNLQPVARADQIKAADAAVCKVDLIGNDTLVVNNGGLGNVFIYLEKAPAGTVVGAPPEQKIMFDQKNCRFEPHALFCRVDQPVQVLNSDGVAHNTHTYPKRNKTFNTVVKINDQVGVPLVYDKAEKIPLEIKCDFHPWMRAWHLPLDHPFAVCTEKDGSFEIKDLPAGAHKFKVWHEKAGLLERGYEIVVEAGDNEPIEIRIPGQRVSWFEGPEPRLLKLANR